MSSNPYQPPPPPLPGQPWPQQQQSYYPPNYFLKPPTSGKAIASLVLGIASIPIWPIGWILGPLGFIFGINSKKEIRSGRGSGEGLAMAGMVTGIIGTVTSILFVAWMLVWILVIMPGMFEHLSEMEEITSKHMEDFENYMERRTTEKMQDFADALDDYQREKNFLPEDTTQYDGHFSNDKLWQALRYELYIREQLKDSWERPLVYDRLKGTGDELEVNEAFGYDKSILDEVIPHRPPAYIIWSRGADDKDPGDDIFFIEGSGIVRPPGYAEIETDD